MDTKYTITTWPKENASEELQKALEKQTIYLEALYDGNDPFTTDAPF